MQLNQQYWRQDPLNCTEQFYPIQGFPQDFRDAQPIMERLIRAYLQSVAGSNPVRIKTYNILSNNNYQNDAWHKTVVFSGVLVRFYVNTVGGQVSRDELSRRAAKDAADFYTLQVFENSPELNNAGCPQNIAQGMAAFKSYISQILNQLQQQPTQSAWGQSQQQQSAWGQQQNAWGTQKKDSTLDMFQNAGHAGSDAIFRKTEEGLPSGSTGNAYLDQMMERERLEDERARKAKEEETRKATQTFSSGAGFDQFSGGPSGYNVGANAETGHGFQDHFESSQHSTTAGAPHLDWVESNAEIDQWAHLRPKAESPVVEDAVIVEPTPVAPTTAPAEPKWVQTPVGTDFTNAIHPGWDYSNGKPPYMPYVEAVTPIPRPDLPVPVLPAKYMGIRVYFNIYTQQVIDGWIYNSEDLFKMDEKQHQLRYDLRRKEAPVGRVVPIYELNQDDSTVEQDHVTESPLVLEQAVAGLEIDAAAHSVFTVYNVVPSNRPAHFVYMNTRAVQMDQQYPIQDVLGNFVWTGKHANADLGSLVVSLRGLRTSSEYLYQRLNTFATETLNRILRYELNTVARMDSFADDYQELLEVLRKKYGDSILVALARCAPQVARSVACICPPEFEDRLFCTTVTPFTALGSGFKSTPKGMVYTSEEDYTRVQTEIGDPDTPLGIAVSFFVGMVRLNYMACVPWSLKEMGVGELKVGERLLFTSSHEYHTYFESVLAESESGAPMSRVTIVTPNYEAIDLHRSEVGTQGAIVVERRSVFG